MHFRVWGGEEFASRHEPSSDLPCCIRFYVYSISRKRSKAVQKMISHSSQHSFSIGALSENAGYRHGTHHRTKNDAKVLLSHPCRRAGHELHPLTRPIVHQAGDSFPDSELGA